MPTREIPIPLDVAAVRGRLAAHEARVRALGARLTPAARGDGDVGDAVEQVEAALCHLGDAVASADSARCRRALEALERALGDARQVALDRHASDIVGLALTDLHADVRALLMETEPDDAARLEAGFPDIASRVAGARERSR